MIRVLDAETIGQIAAGEVIERPHSVVKELVENAVDAGASRVTVSVTGGGLEAIEVVDDGSGISPEQLPLAVRRHATSKLSNASDLESIVTLGFRGEGLASIASVARLRVASRTEGSEIGAAVEAHAEIIGPLQPVASPLGTSVIARELFGNVPVRREYLRSPRTEFGQISNWLATFALAYPHVTFALYHDGKEIWTMASTPDFSHRLAAVFGKQQAQHLLVLESAAGRDLAGDLRGYISVPGHDRPDRRMQLLFVNGRLLRSSLLAGAWTAGYSSYAMSGRQPYGVLELSLPPDHVDSNVHPTKSDVRLRFGRHVFDAVRRSIVATLNAHASRNFVSNVSFAPPSSTPPVNESLFELSSGNGTAPSGAPRLRLLAQLDATFILATDGTGLLLVDQHAAHERIAYECIAAAAAAHAPSEPLLVPLVFEVDAAQEAALERTRETLREGGLEIEPFGERTYRLVATPAGYGARTFDVSGFLEELAEEPKQRDVRERLWASLACHSVTRAGDRLDAAEMTALVDRLQHCVNPMHCPHGRPTMVQLDSDAIARLFKRM
ncbi:MAG: DNA mismatch repair endonuclease MutL [Candidatus Eremiobacteraeota bacterium]|nr:DNA mismatch repair endonuclease MutL [Candidatus Eremiobacteraeota bacterium]